MADAEANAERFPDMLALIFATLATGMQMGVHDKHGDWLPGAVEQTRKTSDVYGECHSFSFIDVFWLTAHSRGRDAGIALGILLELAHSAMHPDADHDRSLSNEQRSLSRCFHFVRNNHSVGTLNRPTS